MKPPQSNFWRKHPGLVWSNSKAGDSAQIRAALLRPRFGRLLDIALEFGTSRLRREWAILWKERTPDARLAQPSVQRILAHIEEGFHRAASRH